MDPQAIFNNFRRNVTEHYFDLHGRVGRSEFWYFVLANFVFAIIAAILQSATFLPIASLYNLAMLLPAAGMGARRLQDTGRDGKLIWIFIFAALLSQIIALFAVLSFYGLGLPLAILYGGVAGLINLVLLIAAVVLIYFWCQPGDPGPNAYGPVPPVFDPSRPVMPSA
jgi:uncharacterized membrane protein YhaH (DUF805 family)